jgi:hypothetical protein
MNDRNKYIRRIQKLKALAAGEAQSGNDMAADSAMRIAAKLMLEHAIAQAEVDSPIDDDPMVTRDAQTGRQLVWLRALYHDVATANNCSTSYMPRTDTVTFYGTRSDCEIAEYLAIYLARQVQRAADDYIHRAKLEVAENNSAAGYTRYSLRKGLRQSFCHTAVATLRTRLQAMRREAADEVAEEQGEAAVSTALVVLKNKLARAEDFRNTFTLNRGRANSYTHNSAGADAGNKININRGLDGSSVPALT